jgi:hypothetical protein
VANRGKIVENLSAVCRNYHHHLHPHLPFVFSSKKGEDGTKADGDEDDEMTLGHSSSVNKTRGPS